MAMNTQAENPLDSVMYSYTTDNSRLEMENKILKETVSHLQNELNKFRQPALMVCDVVDLMENNAIIKTPNGNKFYVSISNQCNDIKSGDTVLAEQKNLTIIRKIQSNKRFNVEKFVIIEKPTTKWEEIGGLDKEVQEIIEVIELPLKNPQVFKKIGIEPPKGILLHGPPGTGKTLLAKGVAAATNATFIEIVGSELVQKFIGEGAKLVKEIFELAREKAPSIVFIDEIDALAAKRIELGTSGEREVQRTFMQLLAELDGFKPLGNVKIIGCTNRKDILDTAIIRPGRLERLIEVGLPNKEGIAQIFKIHSKKMAMEKNINIESFLKKMQGMSGAEVQAICTEAGYFAIRNNRIQVSEKDFLDAIEKILKKEEGEKELPQMFG
ncbi:AAA family ATPase [Candidatus Woesearchaeota archaeon]|nr:AAA family ATPase [Candidatus Woesearchaeota archaeon]